MRGACAGSGETDQLRALEATIGLAEQQPQDPLLAGGNFGGSFRSCITLRPAMWRAKRNSMKQRATFG